MRIEWLNQDSMVPAANAGVSRRGFMKAGAVAGASAALMEPDSATSRAMTAMRKQVMQRVPLV